MLTRLHNFKSSFLNVNQLVLSNWPNRDFEWLMLACGPDSWVGIAIGYGLESNPGGGEIFRTLSDRPWAPPTLLRNGYRGFPGGKERPRSDADPSPLLVPWSWKGRAIPLLPLWAVRPVQCLSACTRVTFTFNFLMLVCFKLSQTSKRGAHLHNQTKPHTQTHTYTQHFIKLQVTLAYIPPQNFAL